MSDLEHNLKRDATAIDVTVDAALRERIDAAWQTAQKAPARGRLRRGHVLGWGSVVTGIAAAVLFLAIANRPPPAELPVSVAASDGHPAPLPLSVEPVNLAGPLQAELNNLQADLRLARKSIEDELRASF